MGVGGGEVDAVGEAAARMRISDFAGRADVTTHALRVWERRYGLFDPARSESGYRLYDGNDLHRLLVFRRLVDDGRRAGDAARLALAEVPLDDLVQGSRIAAGTQLASGDSVPDLAESADELHSALMSLDESRTELVLGRLVEKLPLEVVLAEIVVSALQRLGVDWLEGRLPVVHGQFAFHLLRHQVIRLGGPPEKRTRGVVWLACPPREAHDIIVVVAAALLRRMRWNVSFFGANTSVTELVRAARCVPGGAPDVVLLSAQRSTVLHSSRMELAELAATCPVALAGHGVRREMAESVGATHLRGGISSALTDLDVYRKR